MCHIHITFDVRGIDLVPYRLQGGIKPAKRQGPRGLDNISVDFIDNQSVNSEPHTRKRREAPTFLISRYMYVVL